MKNPRLLPLLLSASLVSALGLSAVSPALAQPPAKAAKKAKAAKGGMSKKMVEKIETLMGKPLTADQKERLNAAYKARSEATKALNEKFAGEIATVTGLTAAQVADMNKRGPKAGAKAPA